jgi:exodeoxyribonuclease VII large subunit
MEPGSNIPELSVSELAFSLKRTLEETYGRVRVRGELSRVKIHTSGHLYSDLKDADSVINIVCWRSTLAKLSIRPEEGLEVICTGKITTYPARSNYQLIVDKIELAGEGALLKMLEDRKKRLAAEGLFEESRKRPIPFLPGVIGVVTSETGAVIRDILHRLADRFPRRVIVWPVRVQGDGAAEEIANAIRGFSELKSGESIPKPDLVIVARGGGSLEDLMPFNEEIVVRAAAECSIPLISAVGHETDTTLIDFAADLRAPTPTAAAEMAVPERLSLIAQVEDNAGRLRSSLTRLLREKRQEIAAWSARLADPARLLDLKIQSLDHISDRLSHSLSRRISAGNESLLRLSGRLVHPGQILRQMQQALTFQSSRLVRIRETLLEGPQRKLDHELKLLEALSFRGVLARGYAVVRDNQGQIVAKASQTTAGQGLSLEFSDGFVKTQVEEKP